jgi:hypothetical protein
MNRKTFITMLFLAGIVSQPVIAEHALLIASSSANSSLKVQEQSIDELIIEKSKKNRHGSFEIEDQRIDLEVINRTLTRIGKQPIDELTVGADESMAVGEKRCTKWNKKGRRFCVQRMGFLYWKFGWEYK